MTTPSSRSAQLDIEVTNVLNKEIQARPGAGAFVEQVAAASGSDTLVSAGLPTRYWNASHAADGATAAHPSWPTARRC